MWEKEDCPLSLAFKEDLTTIDTVIPAVKDIRIPWLLIHGKEDDVVFPNHSEDLYENLKGQKKLVIYDKADHHFENELPEMLEEIASWIEA